MNGNPNFFGGIVNGIKKQRVEPFDKNTRPDDLLLDMKSVFGSRDEFFNVLYNYEMRKDKRKKLQYLSFSNAAKENCPEIDFKNYTKDVYKDMQEHFCEICMALCQKYIKSKYFKKNDDRNDGVIHHRISNMEDMYIGKDNRKSYIKPVAIYAASVALVSKNVELMQEMHDSYNTLFDHIQKCRSICNQSDKLSH